MEVKVVSRELVKPSSPEVIQTKPPHKLCLFDQLTPLTYAPLIAFYANPESNPISNLHIIQHLKRSMAETLDIYYPFSGRTGPGRGNVYIDNFNEGVPFTIARVSCRIAHFLKRHETELLNLLLPRQPFQREVVPADRAGSPVLELQVSVFSCGGISLGWACSHKLIDAATMRSFFKTFCAVSRGERDDIVSPDFARAAALFPPREPFPESHLNLMETLWFNDGINYVTRRFAFDFTSIEKLRAAMAAAGGGEGNKVVKQSRVEALSCLIWKCSMAASRALSGSPKTSIMVQAVNLRDLTDPQLPENSIGNVFWWATAAGDESSNELRDLAAQMNEAMGLYKSDYVRSLQGEEGFEAISSYFEQLEGLFAGEKEKPDILAFTSWSGFGATRRDFGWGKPVWVAAMGKAGRGFRNLTVFLDSSEGRGGIEAWVTLEEKRMAIVERDPDLLAFASPSPKISSL